MKEKVVVGMSGGVDSSVAALLLKKQGYDVIGVTMQIWQEEDSCQIEENGGCCGLSAVEDARRVADTIGIPHYVMNFRDIFKEKVISNFISEYMIGRTPNPCIVCNRNMKFGMLPKLAEKEIGFDKFATGHYARIVERSGRLAIASAADEGKDQSYFLWGLSQEQIARAMFPLGTLSKGEVRNIAREAGLPMADKQDSQDFYSGDSNELLDTEDRPGDIVTTDGKKLGRHRGYWHYTVGQRQGLGIGGGTPFYVVRIEPCRNEVVVGRREDAVASSLVVCDLNWQGIAETAEPVTGFVKIRSTGRPIGPVTLENGVLRASCDLFGVAPGQSAVLYGADGTILCGGIIEK